jgi:hypothetical protein
MVVAEIKKDDPDTSTGNSITDPDATLDDSFRFRLYSNEKAALQRAARDADRRPGNMTRVIVREWLRTNGYLDE